MPNITFKDGGHFLDGTRLVAHEEIEVLLPIRGALRADTPDPRQSNRAFLHRWLPLKYAGVGNRGSMKLGLVLANPENERVDPTEEMATVEMPAEVTLDVPIEGTAFRRPQG